VNVILYSQNEIITAALGLSRIGSAFSAAPWIPITPDPQQDQDLGEQWEEAYDD
jgi:hypothetical protein